MQSSCCKIFFILFLVATGTPFFSTYACEMQTDYPIDLCRDDFVVVKNQAELDQYLTDYGYVDGKYRNLTIDFSIDLASVEVHAPCKIVVSSRKILTSNNICLDGRYGVETGAGGTLNGGSIGMLSQFGQVQIGDRAVVRSDSLTISSNDDAIIGDGSDIVSIGKVEISSTNNDVLISDRSMIFAIEFKNHAANDLIVGAGVELGIAGIIELVSENSKVELHDRSKIDGTALKISAKNNIEVGRMIDLTIIEDTQINSLIGAVYLRDRSNINVGSFNVEALNTIQLGYGAELNSSERIVFHTLSETIGFIDIKDRAIITATNLDLTSNGNLEIGRRSNIYIENHFHAKSSLYTIEDSAVLNATYFTGNVFGNPNDAPVISGDEIILRTQTNTAINFTVNGATDLDGGLILYFIDDQPSVGVLEGCLQNNEDLTCRYTPEIDYSGVVTFTYRATDGVAESDPATVTIIVNSPPVMNGDESFTTLEDQQLTFALNGATDFDGDALTYEIVEPPLHGTLSNCLANSGDLSCDYTPNLNFNGIDTFTYRANDGALYSENVSTVSIAISPVNDIPIMVSDETFQLNEDELFYLQLSGATDVDGDTLTYEIIEIPANGTLSNCLGYSGDLTCNYTPNLNFYGSDRFTYRVHDGTLYSSNVSVVSLVISSVNDHPTMISDQTFQTNEDESVSFQLSGATDIEGDILTYELVAMPANGILLNCLASSGDLTCDYISNLNFNGIDTFTYRANDGISYSDNLSTISIIVLPINDIPEMISDQTFETNEDELFSFQLNGATDVDGDMLTYEIIEMPVNGILSNCLANDGDLTCDYAPNLNFNGSDSFTYRVYDGTLYSDNVSTVSLVIFPVNDRPIIGENQFVNATISQTHSFSVNAGMDVDGDLLLYEVMENTLNGELINCFQTAGDNSCEYRPFDGFSGTDRFTYRVKDNELISDGIAEVIITVDPPILQIEVVQIESGDYHTCVLLNNGKIRCWGDNRYGQLGNGNTTTVGSQESPFDHIYEAGSVLLEESAVKIALGKKHTCALLASGRIKCWGANSEGQTGAMIFTSYGDEETELPIYLDEVALGGSAVDLWSGEYNNCAKMMSGEIKCWGSFGIGSPILVTPSSAQDLGLVGVVDDLSLGYKHGCALISGGIRCWGEDGFGPEHILGQLGSDSINDIAPLDSIFVLMGEDVTQIATHKDHSCALLDNGAVRCFGSNYTGQLGQGIKEHVGNGIGPSIISLGDIAIGGQATYVKVGSSHSCAILSDGSVRCWGRGDKGQLGYGGFEEIIGDNELPIDIDPVALGGNAISLALGLQHTCVLLDTRKVRCFGNGENGKGALGYGHDQNIGLDILPYIAGDLSIVDDTPNGVNAGLDFITTIFSSYEIEGSVVVPEGDIPTVRWSKIIGPDGVHFSEVDQEISHVRFIYPGEYILRLESIIDGDSFSDYVNVSVSESSKRILALGMNRTCRIRIDGRGECLGDEVLESSAVTSTIIPDLDEIISISSKSAVSCVVENGKVKCWGIVHGTGIGLDDASYSYDKIEISGIDNALSVATSGNSACALLLNGRIKCWGKIEASDWGILGDGNRADSLLPVEVLGIDNAIKISMGSQHACALLNTGKISCWGKTAVPEVFLLNSPAEVSTLENVLDMDTGNFSTCAISDRVYCWGFSYAPDFSLLEVANSTNAQKIASGSNHSCYISDSKNVWCFGDNSKGQLGTGDIISSEVPIMVTNIENIVEIAAGRDHTCAYSDENEFYCWGDNSNNQMGNINSEIITIPTLLFE